MNEFKVELIKNSNVSGFREPFERKKLSKVRRCQISPQKRDFNKCENRYRHLITLEFIPHIY